MKHYTVTWLGSVQEQLSALWVASKAKQAITNAANGIDRELAVDAASKGTPTREGFRSLSISPLLVLFTVSELDRIVEVVSLRVDRELLEGASSNGATPPADGHS